MLRRHTVLLIAIRPSDGDVKPGGPLGAFREGQAMSRLRVSPSPFLSSSHTTQLHYTNITIFHGIPFLFLWTFWTDTLTHGDKIKSSEASSCYLNRLKQRLSNYGPRTTCGPRGMPFWSLKKDSRKNRIQMKSISLYSRKSHSLLMTHGNRLSLFLPYWHFKKLITLLIYWLPTLLQQQKRDSKYYEGGVSHHFFPANKVPRL